MNTGNLKDLYTKDEVIEMVRQVIFEGTPELYDNGGILGTIPMPPNFTYNRTIKAINKYYIKN